MWKHVILIVFLGPIMIDSRASQIVEDFLHDVMGASPVGSFEFIQIPPFGWYVWVVAYPSLATNYLSLDLGPVAMMIAYKKGFLRAIGSAECRGFEANGRPILNLGSTEGKILENLVMFFNDPYYRGSFYHP